MTGMLRTDKTLKIKNDHKIKNNNSFKKNIFFYGREDPTYQKLGILAKVVGPLRFILVSMD